MTERERIEEEVNEAVKGFMVQLTDDGRAVLAEPRVEFLTWAFRRQRAEGLRRAAEMAEAGRLGQPERYNWAKQNYNGGWDQSRYRLAAELRAAADEMEEKR